jgi:nitronate monooxygenase
VISTWLTERFGLSVPVVCAPMAGVSGGRLAAAVSEAGALGMVGFGMGDPALLTTEIENAVAAVADKPFGVGLMAWVLERQPELLDLVLDAKPSLLSVSVGDYARHLERIRDAGVVVVTQIGTVREAREAERAGVDLIVARGGEGGGHGRDVVATLPLLQGVLDAVDVPVLAAGGIGTGRGVAAVIAAGAAGAWVGTAFAACVEAMSSDASRASIVSAQETDTIYTTVLDIGRRVPWPSEFGGRAIRNAFAERWHGRADELVASGEQIEELTVWAGQAAGLVTAERPAADVVAELARAEDFLAAAAARRR